jgi:neutral ceramidase
LFAGTARLDITPYRSLWMDGMIRAHPSVGIHDPLFVRAMLFANGPELDDAYVIVSVDVCTLPDSITDRVREVAETRMGIPAAHIIIAATHTHSAPATLGLFNPAEPSFVAELVDRLVEVIGAAAACRQPALIGIDSGCEQTVSHYRRLLGADGHVVMNWEPYPPEAIIGPLGIGDPEVGVLRVVAADGQPLGLLFNHAGHPDVLSGDNYLLSAEYPGLAVCLLEREFGGLAMFVNGAQGSVDIDGLQDRDWAGMERAGRVLARSAAETARSLVPAEARIRGAACCYTLAGRVVTDDEWRWAEQILAQTGGEVQALPDGVGDDFWARFLQEMRAAGRRDWTVEQICLAIGDCALLSFPGELYTEIGQALKAQSPFRRTYIIGLANGYVGYIPTAKALAEGGYAEDMRWIDNAEATVVERSLALLRDVYHSF